MALPILRHVNPRPSDGGYSVGASSQPRLASRRNFPGSFQPGLRIIVIQPDGGEERGLAWWEGEEGGLLLESPRDWRDLPVLLLPSPEGADWEI